MNVRILCKYLVLWNYQFSLLHIMSQMFVYQIRTFSLSIKMMRVCECCVAVIVTDAGILNNLLSLDRWHHILCRENDTI